jgi:lycopene cyclase domain-containing protein
MKFEYLLLMAACLLLTLPLEFWLRARVYRRPVRLAVAVLPVLVVFSIWDAIAIARGHWSYSPDHTVGWLLPAAIPLEEVVFFIAIPICGLLTYEAVGTVLHRAARPPTDQTEPPDRSPRSFGSGDSSPDRSLRSFGSGDSSPDRSLRSFGSGATEASRRAADHTDRSPSGKAGDHDA